MYTKEELYPIIKKIWETSEHPNVKDDFETVWGIREKYFPFQENEFDSDFKTVFLKDVELKYITNKKELMKALEDVPDDDEFDFYVDSDGKPFLDIYTHEPITIEMVARKIYDTLNSWACLSAYAMYKRMNALEKENEELKGKLKEKPFGDVKLLIDEEELDKLAIEYVGDNHGYTYTDIDDLPDHLVSEYDTFKAGYRKAMKQ